MTIDRLHLTPTRLRRLETHATRIATALNVERRTVFDKIVELLRPYATNHQLTDAINRVEDELRSGKDA